MLRPSVIFGAHDRFLNLFASMQSVLPVVPLAGASARFQPVWVEDVATAIAWCLNDPSTIGKTYECAGPRVYTLEQLVNLAGRLSGSQRAVIPLPDGLGVAQAHLMEMLPGVPLMSRDNMASMRVPNVATPGALGLEALGISAATLEAVGPTYLARQSGVDRFNQWRTLRGRARTSR